MARSQAVALQEGLSPEETAQMDEMRQADVAPVNEGQEEANRNIEEQIDNAHAQENDEKAPGGFVPRSRLNEETERRRQTETRLAEIERQNTTLQERTNIILNQIALQQQQRQPQQEIQEPPALDKDPVGYLVGTLQRQGDVIQQLMQDAQQRGQQTQQLSQALTLQQHAAALENDYKASNPDYEAGLKHLLEARHKDLVSVGIRDPAARQQIISNEYLTVAQLALNDRRNPAEVIYELAQGRGFKPNGAAAQEVIPPAPSAAERVANVAAGQQQSRSLSSVRGAAPVPLTAQRLLEMSPEEFAKIYDTPEGKALRGF